jgi:phage/plasmid-associated DNA primase
MKKDTINSFLSQHVKPSTGSRTVKSDLYQAYQEYCRTTGQEPEDKKAFNQRVKQLPGTYLTQGKVFNQDGGTRSTPCWHGLHYSEEPLPPGEQSAHELQRGLTELTAAVTALEQVTANMREELSALQEQVNRRTTERFECRFCHATFSNPMSMVNHELHECEKREEIKCKNE